MVEAVDGSRIAHDIGPVSDSDVLVALMVHRFVITCQKDDETELQNYHKECNQETKSTEVL